MKVINETHYDTRFLSRLINATHVHQAKFAPKGRLKNWPKAEVKVQYHKKGGYLPQVTVTSSYFPKMTLTVPYMKGKPTTQTRAIALMLTGVQPKLRTTGLVAAVRAGLLNEPFFGKYTARRKGESDYTWVRKGFGDYVPLREPKVSEKPKKDIPVERYKRVVDLQAKWERKLKLATTKLKKIRTRRRQYEKRYGDKLKEVSV